jgi:hypothetical protein
MSENSKIFIANPDFQEYEERFGTVFLGNTKKQYCGGFFKFFLNFKL